MAAFKIIDRLLFFAGMAIKLLVPKSYKVAALNDMPMIDIFKCIIGCFLILLGCYINED